jgi:hypothetical protein
MCDVKSIVDQMIPFHHPGRTFSMLLLIPWLLEVLVTFACCSRGRKSMCCTTAYNEAVICCTTCLAVEARRLGVGYYYLTWVHGKRTCTNLYRVLLDQSGVLDRVCSLSALRIIK